LVGKGGECDVPSRHLHGCNPPPMSVKDQWVAPPHEQVLNVLIAYWRYGPSKPSRLLSINVWVKPTSLMVVLGEKLMWILWATRLG
jgi:hypothetical protein